MKLVIDRNDAKEGDYIMVYASETFYSVLEFGVVGNDEEYYGSELLECNSGWNPKQVAYQIIRTVDVARDRDNDNLPIEYSENFPSPERRRNWEETLPEDITYILNDEEVLRLILMEII